MDRPTPPSDWVAYIVVITTVIAMLIGKYMMFFDGKKPEESEAEQFDDEIEEIIEETLEEKIK